MDGVQTKATRNNHTKSPLYRMEMERKKGFLWKMHPDKTFFVIRRAYCKVGLFSYVMTNMGLVDYALKKGYIPVIDMQNCKNTYLEDDKVGKENAWEYFFKQPCGYGLEDIKNAQNVILSNGLITSETIYPDFRIMEDKGMFTYWHELFQKYFKISDKILREYEKLRRELFGGRKSPRHFGKGNGLCFFKAQRSSHPAYGGANL